LYALIVFSVGFACYLENSLSAVSIVGSTACAKYWKYIACTCFVAISFSRGIYQWSSIELSFHRLALSMHVEHVVVVEYEAGDDLTSIPDCGCLAIWNCDNMYSVGVIMIKNKHIQVSTW